MLARAGSQWRLPKRQAICPSREHRTVALRARNKRAPDLRRKLATGLLPEQSRTRIVRC
jgi:hypothetical protein